MENKKADIFGIKENIAAGYIPGSEKKDNKFLLSGASHELKNLMAEEAILLGNKKLAQQDLTEVFNPSVITARVTGQVSGDKPDVCLQNFVSLMLQQAIKELPAEVQEKLLRQKAQQFKSATVAACSQIMAIMTGMQATRKDAVKLVTPYAASSLRILADELQQQAIKGLPAEVQAKLLRQRAEWRLGVAIAACTTGNSGNDDDDRVVVPFTRGYRILGAELAGAAYADADSSEKEGMAAKGRIYTVFGGQPEEGITLHFEKGMAPFGNGDYALVEGADGDFVVKYDENGCPWATLDVLSFLRKEAQVTDKFLVNFTSHRQGGKGCYNNETEKRLIEAAALANDPDYCFVSHFRGASKFDCLLLQVNLRTQSAKVICKISLAGTDRNWTKCPDMVQSQILRDGFWRIHDIMEYSNAVGACQFGALCLDMTEPQFDCKAADWSGLAEAFRTGNEFIIK